MNEPVPDQPMRVVHFVDNLGMGGKERQLVELVKGTTQSGTMISVIVSMTEGIFYQELEQIPGIEIVTMIRKWRFDPSVSVSLSRLLTRFRADVIVAWDHMTAVYAVPAALITRTRLINAMIQDAPEKLSKKAWLRARVTFPFSYRIISCSQAGLDAYRANYAKARVIHNGFDTERTKSLAPKSEVRRRFGITAKYVVGMVATFRSTKDQPTLIEAARLILGNRDDVCFVFAGDGERLEECRQLCSGLKASNIHFLGAIQQDLESLINLFDVGVLATFTEGISNSIMEYMALSKPVVASRGGGTVELVIDHKTGILVEPRNPTQMAAAITELLNDETLRLHMGNAGLARLLDEFSLKKLAEQHLRVYAHE